MLYGMLIDEKPTKMQLMKMGKSSCASFPSTSLLSVSTEETVPVPIQDIWKHVDLKGTDASSYEDCGMNVQDVEYELECQDLEEWDSDCEDCSESEDGVVDEEI